MQAHQEILLRNFSHNPVYFFTPSHYLKMEEIQCIFYFTAKFILCYHYNIFHKCYSVYISTKYTSTVWCKFMTYNNRRQCIILKKKKNLFILCFWSWSQAIYLKASAELNQGMQPGFQICQMQLLLCILFKKDIWNQV